MKVIIDKETQAVVGLNRPATVFEIEVEVPDTQDVQEGMFVHEVLLTKYQNMLNASDCDYIIADAFLTEDDLDLTHPKHKADTGAGIVRIHPGGQVITKSIELTAESSKFRLLEANTDQGIEIYIEDVKFNEGEITTSYAMTKTTVCFKNPTDRFIFVRSYAVGYKGV